MGGEPHKICVPLRNILVPAAASEHTADVLVQQLTRLGCDSFRDVTNLLMLNADSTPARPDRIGKVEESLLGPLSRGL